MTGHPPNGVEYDSGYRDGLAKATEQIRELTEERDEARGMVETLLEERKLVTITCVFCGHAYPNETPTHGADLLRQHVAECEKHPLRIAEKERDEAKDALAWIRQKLELPPDAQMFTGSETIAGRLARPSRCWHCHAELITEPPNCSDCPRDGECDVDKCDEPGCLEGIEGTDCTCYEAGPGHMPGCPYNR